MRQPFQGSERSRNRVTLTGADLIREGFVDGILPPASVLQPEQEHQMSLVLQVRVPVSGLLPLAFEEAVPPGQAVFQVPLPLSGRLGIVFCWAVSMIWKLLVRKSLSASSLSRRAQKPW